MYENTNRRDKVFFKDRQDAALKLIDVLPVENMVYEEWMVLSTSSASFPIGYEIAKSMKAPFDFMFNEKINAPYNDECEVAIVTETEEVVIHEELAKSFEISLDFIFSSAKKIYDEKVIKDVHKYRRDKRLTTLEGRNVLLVDEGINTGLTMMACIKTAINLGAKSVSVATPILPEVTVADIESIADDLYYVRKLPHFVSIDFYYEKLEKITYDEIMTILKDK